jgi:hypothetical protein
MSEINGGATRRDLARRVKDPPYIGSDVAGPWDDGRRLKTQRLATPVSSTTTLSRDEDRVHRIAL